MSVNGLTWSEPRVAMGHAPVGEIETRCPGCGQRFISGEDYVTRGLAGILTSGIYAHPGVCAIKVEEMISGPAQPGPF